MFKPVLQKIIIPATKVKIFIKRFNLNLDLKIRIILLLTKAKILIKHFNLNLVLKMKEMKTPTPKQMI